jgi:hypothetical protein
VVSLIEIVYHWFKALELDPDVGKRAICGRIRKALQEYLQTLLVVIDEDDWPIYLPQLRAYWEADEELKETAQRATGGFSCYERLSRDIGDFVDKNM